MEKLKEDLKILIESDYWQYLPEPTKHNIRGILGEDKWSRDLHRTEDSPSEELKTNRELFEVF